ncbi:unnamed protein product [Diplocarpon coronariae]|uniref:Ubiquinol-cytochrome c chaperone domain-containing protein n=1 Tax=Diplocarpon coronariae TaxID=2795749 RepID=A0A218Z7H4_9HELO|nr:hypothetical protein B2J93_686 [Marssonina coronariae]
MATSTGCSRLRALQRRLRSVPQVQVARLTTSHPRAVAAASTRNTQPVPPSVPPSTSVPPVTPDRAEGQSKTATPMSAGMRAAAKFQSITGRATETYTAYGATEILYRECARQAEYSIPQATNIDEEMPKTADGEDLGVGDGWWLTEAGLKPTFSTWSQVTMLHMYLLSVRLRCFPAPSAQPWQQHLLDHFFYDAENRMTVSHNMHARGTRNKYLKDLFVQWRGLLAAYDEGLVRGDAVLAAAIWRNIYKASDDVDIRTLAQIVSYMRRALKALDSLPDKEIGKAASVFGNPEADGSTVRLRSSMMALPFEKTPGKDVPQRKQP